MLRSVTIPSSVRKAFNTEVMGLCKKAPLILLNVSQIGVIDMEKLREIYEDVVVMIAMIMVIISVFTGYPFNW